MELKVFIDADNTFVRGDAGNVQFSRVAGGRYDLLPRDVTCGNISATEMFRRRITLVAPFDPVHARQSLAAYEPVSGFTGFVEFCRQHGVEFHILSEGLDYTVEEILRIQGLTGISVAANHAVLLPVGDGGEVQLDVEFPYTNAECDRCACCKRNIILTRSGNDDVVVYIGAGVLNECPARYADIIFAKGALQTFCQRENISYYLFDTFDDITCRLQELLGRRRLHKRLKAEHLRREAYLCE